MLRRIILIAIAMALGCERPKNEVMRAYGPMRVVGLELAAAQGRGEKLPESFDVLCAWVARPEFAQTDEQRQQAAEFCRRGLYVTNTRDTKGRVHGHMLLYYVTTEAGPNHKWVSTYSSADGWLPLNYSEDQARQLFGADLVDRLIERHRVGQPAK